MAKKKTPLPLLSSLPDRKAFTRRMLTGDPWVVTNNLSPGNLKHFLSYFYHEAVEELNKHSLPLIEGFPRASDLYSFEQATNADTAVFGVEVDEAFEAYFDLILESDPKKFEVQANALQILRSVWRICLFSAKSFPAARSQWLETAVFEMLNLVFAAIRLDFKHDLQAKLIGASNSQRPLLHQAEAKRKDAEVKNQPIIELAKKSGKTEIKKIWKWIEIHWEKDYPKLQLPKRSTVYDVLRPLYPDGIRRRQHTKPVARQ